MDAKERTKMNQSREITCFSRDVRDIPIHMIKPNPRQPRRIFDDDKLASLSESVRRYGILQPITCKVSGDFYEIVAGERRYRAAIKAGFYSVPVIVIDADESESAELAIIENLQREDLNIFEEASAISSLIFIYRLTQSEAAERLAVSQSYIANKLRLLRFTDAERVLILEEGLSERHARCLLRLSDENERTAALKHIISRKMNVSASEKYVETLLSAPKARTKPPKFIFKDLRLFYNSLDRSAELIRTSGVPVKIDRDERGEGVIVTVTIGNVSRETKEK